MDSVLKQLRQSRGLSQSAVARALKTSQGHVGDVESGSRGLTPDFATKLAGVYGVDGEALLVADRLGRVRDARKSGSFGVGEALKAAGALQEVPIKSASLSAVRDEEVQALVALAGGREPDSSTKSRRADPLGWLQKKHRKNPLQQSAEKSGESTGRADRDMFGKRKRKRHQGVF